MLARPTLYLTPPAKLSRERPTSISTPAVSTAKLPTFRPPSPTQTSPTLPQSYTAVSSSSFVLLDQRLALAAAPLLHLTAARVIANPIVWANHLAAALSKNLEDQVGISAGEKWWYTCSTRGLTGTRVEGNIIHLDSLQYSCQSY